MKRLYLDVCVLCRPYDDQRSLRIRLETDAVFLIIEAVRLGRYQLIASPVHSREIGAIQELRERAELTALLKEYADSPDWSSADLRPRAEFLHQEGLGMADAAHLAFAEAGADCFISCDDRLLKRAKRAQTTVDVFGPIDFCLAENIR